MNQTLKKRLANIRLETTITSFHLVFAIAPAVGAIITALMEDEEAHYYVEAGLLIAVALINFVLLYLHSRVPEEGEERSPLYTFWSDKLPPNGSGDRQSADARIAVIEESLVTDAGTGVFREALKKRFKREFSLGKLKEILSSETRLKSTVLRETKFDELHVELKNRELFFKHVGLGPLNKEDPQKDDPQKDKPKDANTEELFKGFKKAIDKGLQDATAVVLVRTSESDERSWTYRALSDWGYEHSETPILIAKNPDNIFSDDVVAKRFLWIPDEPNELPWSLLQRGLARAKAWRVQATYNRAMVWNILYILVLCIYIGVIWTKDWKRQVHIEAQERITKLDDEQKKLKESLANKKQVNDVVTATTDLALKTERLLRTHIKDATDQSFGVSYWYRIEGLPHILVTTETTRDTQILPNDLKSVIGCTFVKPNHLIEGELLEGWPRSSRTVVYKPPFQKVSEFKCEMADLTMPIKKIYCGSYNDGSPGQSRTVGVCAFTQDSKNEIFSEKALKDLWEGVLEFSKLAKTIEGKKEMSLAVREPKSNGGNSSN